MITTICYGEKKTFKTREEALQFYCECASWCEGSEKERYMNIVLELLAGKTVATDGVD